MCKKRFLNVKSRLVSYFIGFICIKNWLLYFHVIVDRAFMVFIPINYIHMIVIQIKKETIGNNTKTFFITRKI
jgi:hypothetical protein